MDRQVAWFCYHLTTEGLVTAEQCRRVALGLAEANLEAFAQAVFDNGLCTDSQRLEKLGTLAMQESDVLAEPPVNVFEVEPPAKLKPAGPVSVSPSRGDPPAPGRTLSARSLKGIPRSRQAPQIIQSAPPLPSRSQRREKPFPLALGAQAGGNGGGRFQRKYRCPSCGNTGTLGIDANDYRRFRCCHCGADLFANFEVDGVFVLMHALETELAQEQSEGRIDFHCVACHNGVPVGAEHCRHCGQEGPTAEAVARIFAERLLPVDAIPAADARSRAASERASSRVTATAFNLVALGLLGVGIAIVWQGCSELSQEGGTMRPVWIGVALLVGAGAFRGWATDQEAAGQSQDKILDQKGQE